MVAPSWERLSDFENSADDDEWIDDEVVGLEGDFLEDDLNLDSALSGGTYLKKLH